MPGDKVFNPVTIEIAGAYLTDPVISVCRCYRESDPISKTVPAHRSRLAAQTVASLILVCMASIPSFDPGDVQLLISAVQDALRDLKNANEKLGGNDPEMIAAGRRYAIILQKLQSITGLQ